MSRSDSASGTGVLDSLEDKNGAVLQTSDYPGSDCTSLEEEVTLEDQLSKEELEEGFSHEDVIEDIEDGTSSVLSSSLSSTSPDNNECLAFRAPWATPPTATFEKQLRSQQAYLQVQSIVMAPLHIGGSLCLV